MTEQEALESLSLHVDEKTKDYLVSWNAATIVVAFLRDHPDVARALGIGTSAPVHQSIYAQGEGTFVHVVCSCGADLWDSGLTNAASLFARHLREVQS